MADIASTDVVVSIIKSQIFRGSPGGVRKNVVKLVFGDGALTYATATHVPLPSFPSFGMVKQLDHLTLIQNSLATLKYVWTYDYTNKLLIGVEEVAAASSTALAEIANATAIAQQTLYAEAWGW